MTRSRSIAVLLAALALSALVAAAGGLVTTPEIPTWYAGLAKPAWTPPNWAFPVAWNILYLLMALALWRLVVHAAPGPDRRLAITAYFVQLALNAAWSPIFFKWHLIGVGLAAIVALWLAIAVTMRAAWRVDRPAAWLLVPYLAWVTYATTLNAGLLALNGP